MCGYNLSLLILRIIADDSTLAIENRAAKRLQRDVETQASQDPFFVSEETNMVQAINSHLYEQVLNLKKQVANLLTENVQLKQELENCKKK